MNLSWINKKDIEKQFKRKDLTDTQKSRYAIYLMEYAYKEGFDYHKKVMNNALKSNPDLQKVLPTPSFKNTD